MQTGPCLCMSSSCKAPNISCKCSTTVIQREKQNHRGMGSLPLAAFTRCETKLQQHCQVLSKERVFQCTSKASCIVTTGCWQYPSRQILKAFYFYFFSDSKRLYFYILIWISLKECPLAIAMKFHQELLYFCQMSYFHCPLGVECF